MPREVEPREDLAAPELRLLVARVPLDLFAPLEERLAPALDDLARLEPDLVPEDDALLVRDEVDLRAVLRDAPDRELLDAARPRPPPDVLPPRPLPLLLLPSSSPHLPDITRWAASATASAINVPSLLALDIAVVAACDAASAASSPASRIARRALGLALIAAAAAASPAASISRLIAALVILSTALSFDPEDEDEEEEDFFLVVDLAIAWSPSVAKEDTLKP